MPSQTFVEPPPRSTNGSLATPAQAYQASYSVPGPSRPHVDTTASPTAEVLLALDELGFDGAGGGPLDAVPGIPKKGSESPTAREFGKLAERLSGDFEGESIQGRADAGSHRRTDTRVSVGSQSTHRRMPSDSSSNYTLTGMRNMA